MARLIFLQYFCCLWSISLKFKIYIGSSTSLSNCLLLFKPFKRALCSRWKNCKWAFTLLGIQPGPSACEPNTLPRRYKSQLVLYGSKRVSYTYTLWPSPHPSWNSRTRIKGKCDLSYVIMHMCVVPQWASKVAVVKMEINIYMEGYRTRFDCAQTNTLPCWCKSSTRVWYT